MSAATRFDSEVKEWLRQCGGLSPNPIRNDAGETLFFARQLEAISAKTYDVQYPDLKARQLIPVGTGEATPGHTSFTYGTFDMQGRAKIVNDWANDFPNIEVFGVQTTQGIVPIGDSFGYSYQDVWSAQVAGVSLSAKKATAARRAIENKIEDMAAVGDPLAANGLQYGLVNNPNITAVTKGTQVGGTTWATATVAEIQADVAALSGAVFTNTKGIYTADTLVLGTVGYARLASLAQSPTFTQASVLQYIKAQSPWIKNVEYWNRLDTAGAGGKERILAYARDPNVLELVIPMDFFQMPPEVSGATFKINCVTKFGGVAIRYPLAVAYMDGTEP